MKRTRSLRTQLTRASLLTTFIALSISALAFLTHEFLGAREERARDLAAQAVVIAQAVTPALVFNDPDSAVRQLDSLRQKQGLLMAVIFDASGQPFARFMSAG